MDFLFINVEYFLLLIYQLIFSQDIFITQIPNEVLVIWDIFRVLSTVISLLLLTAVVYVSIRLWQIRKEEENAFKAAALAAKERKTAAEAPQTVSAEKNWNEIIEHLGSDNPNDWRLAIIEADVLLEQILTRAGFSGDTLGEQLKGASRGDFATLNEAWEAHSVRNKIAHEGTKYEITYDDAKRVINLYRRVFKDLKYIN